MADPALTLESLTFVSPMMKVESALWTSLNDLHVRKEVDACLQSMLLSVESAYFLEQQLELQNVRQQLERTQAEHRATVLEAHTERFERYSRRVELADELVVELAKLNQELQKLLEWKQEHEYKVRNYDSMLAKLSQTEEELQSANRVSFGGQPKPRQGTPMGSDRQSSSTPAPTGDGQLSSPQRNIPFTNELSLPEESAPEETPETLVEPNIDDGGDQLLPADSGEESLLAEEREKNEDISTEGENAGETLKAAMVTEAENPVAPLIDHMEEDTKPPPVELIQEQPKTQVKQKEQNSANLLTLDVEPLMEIFGYLDPMDILNTAQINMTMYTKVDSIFGISEDGQTPPAPTPAPTPAPASQPTPKSVTKEAKAVPAASNVSGSKAVATTKSSPRPMPKNSSPSATQATGSAAGGPLGKGLLSMLQPAKPLSSASAPVGATQRSVNSTSQPLNAKVAQSMASKLSDAELAAIISMTDKLSKLEKEIHLLRNDKELVAAKLEGTENVKQYVIGKLKDVEAKLQQSRENEVKVIQQIASDQEVIAFLDSRVQELEQQTVDLTKENSVLQAEFDSIKVSTSRKITMLSDMLKYEREKVREDESEWKATKKLLVKEIKSCRAQILTLQAERDGLKGQNDQLNRAINSTSNGSSNRSPGRGRRKYT